MQSYFVTQIQIEFESTKLENRRLRDEVSDLSAELEAVEQLKFIAEKNLAEALELLQQEREQRHGLKKELDQRVASEAMYGLQTLVTLGIGDYKVDGKSTGHDGGSVHPCGHVDEHVDNPALKKIEADFTRPNCELLRQVPAPTQGLIGDLFSEVHVGQIRQLERMLEQTEIEKCNLEQALEQSGVCLAEARAEALASNASVVKLKAELEAMSASTDINGVDSSIVRQFPSYELAVREISVLRNELHGAHQRVVAEREVNELKLSHIELETCKERIARLEVDISDYQEQSSELKHTLCQTKDSLSKISLDLSSLYQSVCQQANESPNKTAIEKLDDEEFTAVTCFKLVETISDQVHFISRAFKRLTELSAAKSDANSQPSSGEAIELQEQVYIFVLLLVIYSYFCFSVCLFYCSIVLCMLQNCCMMHNCMLL